MLIEMNILWISVMMKIRLISLPYIYTSMYFFVKPS